MYGKNALSTYQSVQVTTTDRGRLLIMLFEGAISFFKQAIQGLEDKDVAKFCRFLSKGQAIVAELMSTLDADKGGKIASDLERLYEFVLFYSTEANLHRDTNRLQKCIDLITPVYIAFKEIVDKGVVDQMAAAGDNTQPVTRTAEPMGSSDLPQRTILGKV